MAAPSATLPAPAAAAAVTATGPWREPGQAVDAAYLQTGKLRYRAEDGEIVGRNGPYFNNRPLYCRLNTDGAVLTGDRPLARLIAKPYLLGALSLAIARQRRAVWLHDAAEIESRYHCGRMTWRCSDPTLPGLEVILTVVPLTEVAGFAAQLHVSGAKPGDQLIWAFSGARREEGDPRLNWDPVMRGNPDICRSGDPRRPLLFQGLVPGFCVGNVATIDGPSFRLAATADATSVAVGRASRTDGMLVGDSLWLADPVHLAKSAPSAAPVIVGTAKLAVRQDVLFFAVESCPADAPAANLRCADPAQAFADGVAYLGAVERVRIASPNARLNAAVTAVCHAVDANCERDPYIFRHGCMAFSCRFVGWRVICGATALGWHERVLGNAGYTLGLQKKSDPARTRPSASVERLLVHEGTDSRLYGKGSLDRDFPMYDVQTQFFDQTIAGWRASADPEMERLLRPALELHLEWMQECFDPDDDGLYESYINTLPTDSVWYNGGGSAEQSAYAYTAYRAAADLARRAGDPATAARHQAQMAKIQRALREKLWVQERGHFGLYREQGGHDRVHADAWTYSVFLPIDAGLTSPLEALQSLYYTEWDLERIRLPYGGVLCQLSNWVPWKWSVRDMFGGDLFALALAYFQAGLGDAGYELLEGATLESAYASAVPGGFSHIGAATDFGDNVHMFARTVVEGLYGYAPDYPNGGVRIQPAFPSVWPTASIQTPDFAFSYRQDKDTDHYVLGLTKPAEIIFRLPVRAEKIRRVLVNGRELTGRIEPGFGCTLLTLTVPATDHVELAIELVDRLPQSQPVHLTGRVGDNLALKVPKGQVEEWLDLHQVLEATQPEASGLRGRISAKPGHHLVLARCRCGELPRWEIFKLHLTDPAADVARIVQTPRAPAPGALWDCLDLAGKYNGDIRTIFQQRYLSPRPATCSVRLGVDGYSAWTFPYWGLPPPKIELGHLAQLTDAKNRIVSPQGVPFTRFTDDRNIAFTSLWDNWPTSVEFPVGRVAKTLWLLVCGSTFPMQTRIANAEFRFRYADGQVEKLELMPPDNFWMLCPWGGEDYSYAHDAFALPAEPPPQVQLGANCRAMVLSWKLRPGVRLESVTLEALSQDVVIGLMGLSLETA
ncbi:MAG: protein of unknown function (DUF4450) [Verrucomicrobia bacterium]|nr:MAG: protein of unknown function (DUF4450) [Verrucomicrobiota bacterium]